MKFSDRSRIILTNKRHRYQNRRASLSTGFFQKAANHNYFKSEQEPEESNYLWRL